MSILIKNVQMPKNCSDCPLNYDMMSCMITGTRFWSDTLMDFDCQESRLYDCPLVEIPDKHGRIIDEDEIIIPSLSSWADQVIVADAIQDAPTVIEADRS